MEVIERLKLKIIPHMNLYWVLWLKRGKQVTMIEQCLLNFQIGKISEHVLCDIVEMDAYHVLLGRSWLFDRKIFHDGRRNTYEVLKDGQRYKLEKMVETELSGRDRKGNDIMNFCINSRIMMCSTEELLGKHKNTHFCLSLMPIQVLEIGKMSFVSPEIQPLLNEFKDIVGDDLPSGLPPLRSISHKIDLIPGSSLPNKYPYLMTPIESEEVNRQVQKMLDRGKIQDSLSPYVVPTLLTPKKGGEW
jgi:hypothetical protein